LRKSIREGINENMHDILGVDFCFPFDFNVCERKMKKEWKVKSSLHVSKKKKRLVYGPRTELGC
jgi:hypothetical protein